MDIKTLVVGQEVDIASGPYSLTGEVVRITPEGVEVQATMRGCLTRIGDLLHFDKDGRSYITKSLSDPTAVPGSPWAWDGNGTFEAGPWYIEGPISKEEIARRREIRERNDRQQRFSR